MKRPQLCAAIRKEAKIEESKPHTIKHKRPIKHNSSPYFTTIELCALLKFLQQLGPKQHNRKDA